MANIAPWQGDLSIGIGSAACARGVSASSQGNVTIRALTSQRSIIARAFASRNAASGEPRIALDQRLLDADEMHDRNRPVFLSSGVRMSGPLWSRPIILQEQTCRGLTSTAASAQIQTFPLSHRCDIKLA